MFPNTPSGPIAFFSSRSSSSPVLLFYLPWFCTTVSCLSSLSCLPSISYVNTLWKFLFGKLNLTKSDPFKYDISQVRHFLGLKHVVGNLGASLTNPGSCWHNLDSFSKQVWSLIMPAHCYWPSSNLCFLKFSQHFHPVFTIHICTHTQKKNSTTTNNNNKYIN